MDYIEAALAHAAENTLEESCGVLIVKKGQKCYVKCHNGAVDRSKNFSISAESWVAAEELGEIIGIVHSHPGESTKPSQADKVSCERSGLPWLIVNPLNGDFTSFEPTNYQAPLYGREYCHGVLDCYSFVRDFYREEYGVILREYDREELWWEKGFDLYRDYMKDEGFYPIAEDEMREGDGIIMNISSSVGNHGGIYVGDGKMAHHLYKRLSSKDVYGGYYRKHTMLFVRHKEINQ